MLKSALAFVVLAGAPATVTAQISLVHTTSCGPQTFPGTCSISSTGAGNLIVVGIQLGRALSSTATTIATVIDNAASAGNAYQEANSITSVLSGATSSMSLDTSGGSVVDIWYARNSKAGATAITITPSATVSGAAVIWEFSGVNTTAPLDQVSVLSSQPSSASPTGASATTTLANEVIISIAGVSGSVSGIFSGNPFTNDSTVNGVGWAHLLTGSAGSYAAKWSQSASGTFSSSTVSFIAANASPAFSACDLNQDGVLNVIDVYWAIEMYLSQVGQLQSGQTGYRTCNAVIAGPGVCSTLDSQNQQPLVVEQIQNAALGGACSIAGSHSVLVSWNSSVTSGVNYNVYRSTISGGPYTKLTSITPISGLSYVDSTALAGQTYYYVVTAVNGGGESGYSNQVATSVQFP